MFRVLFTWSRWYIFNYTWIIITNCIISLSWLWNIFFALLLYKWHSGLWGNVSKDHHLCESSSKVEGQDEFLVCSLQYLHNGFALWILGQIYARLQELNYHQLRNTPLFQWSGRNQSGAKKKAKIDESSVKWPYFSRPQWISYFSWHPEDRN